MANQADLQLSLSVGSHAAEDLTVLDFAGREAISRPYRFSIEFAALPGVEVDAASLLGSEACLTLAPSEGEVRHVHGVVLGIAHRDGADGLSRFQIQLEPALTLLARTHRSRIFQGKTCPEIAKEILGDASIAHRIELKGSHPTREFTVQYRESDLAFLSRLLEDEGIAYFFEHGSDSHTLVLVDSADGHPALPGTAASVPLRPHGFGAVGERLSRIERRHQLRPDQVELRDVNLLRPSTDLRGKAKAEHGSALAIYDAPGGYDATGAATGAAKLRLQQVTQEVDTAEAEGACAALSPGFTFEVADVASDLAGPWLIVQTVHRFGSASREGEGSAQVYRTSVVLQPVNIPFRPPRNTPRPRIAGPQTAVVVGDGDETHPDEHHRLKVQFHWDRDGKRDAKSSLWIPLATSWAGPGMGASFVPRVGQEVVVRFLEGDPDRPLIVGAVYHASHVPPADLPGAKTQSAIRTDSSPGGGGFNELRFEDQTDSEEISVHAQKDANTRVEHDHAVQVRRDAGLAVKVDRTRKVDGDQALKVGLDDHAGVSGNQDLTVSKDRSTSVLTSMSEGVTGNQSVAVGGSQTLEVGGVMDVTIGAARALRVGGALTENIAASLSTSVGASLRRTIGGSSSASIGKALSENVAEALKRNVGGDDHIQTEKSWMVEVGQESQEEAKQATIGVTESVEWNAKSFKLKADTFLLAVGGKEILKVEKSGAVKLTAQSLTLDGSEIALKGANIKMEPGSGPSSASKPKAEIEELKTSSSSGSIRVSLAGHAGEALAGKKLELRLPDGSTKPVNLDSDGHAQIDKVPAGESLLILKE